MQHTFHGDRRRSPRVEFSLHYLEMLAVMVAGMTILGPGLGLVASALGYGVGELRSEAPAVVLGGMALSMLVPMTWWMHRRGHSWAANRAMAISMILPTLSAIALLASGAVDDVDLLLAVQHVTMLPAMAVAMLLYRDDYVHRRDTD